jgi:hypothetical protein
MLVTCCIVSSANLAAPAFGAGPIVDTGGFEAPGYALGPLQGQNSWITVGGNSGTATVESTVSLAPGSQALQVNRGASSDDYWFVHVLGYPTQRFVTIDWDMLVNHANSGAFGPFFGVRSFDDHGIPSPGVLGTLGVDATTGDVLTESSNGLSETGQLASFGQWHHFRLQLDFAAKTYQAYFENSQVASMQFPDLALGVNDFTDADISAIAAGGDQNSMAATGTAFFDNFRVTDGVVPEPTALQLLVSGVFTLLACYLRNASRINGPQLLEC